MILRIGALACLLVLNVSCTSDMAFTTIPLSGNSQSSLGEGLILINEGALVTNNSAVRLRLNAAGWEKMYVTNDSSCLSGGQWQKISTSLSNWQLANQNQESSVYVKFFGTYIDREQNEKVETESPCISDSILHDGEAPVVNILEKPKEKTNIVAARFLVEATDAISGVSQLLCSFNNMDFKSCGDETIYNQLTDGAYNFQVKAVDFAGNSSNIQSYNWQLDQTLPVVKWTHVPNTYVGPITGSNFQFEVTDNNAIKEAKCSLNESVYVSCSSPLNYSQLSEGVQSLSLVAEDVFENTSAKISHSWTVDKTGPVIVFDEAASEHKDDQASVFRFRVTDKLSGVNSIQCYLDNQALADCSDGFYVGQNIPAGLHSFKVVAADKVGNESQLQHSWKILKTYDDIEYPINVPDSYNDVDILFVVDNSVSMGNEQRNMAKRLSNFLGHIVDLDWQIAVTTTDPSDRVNGNGRIIKIHGDNAILDPSYSLDEAQVLLGNAVQFDNRGSNKEQGIKAVYNSINRSQNPSDSNYYLHRRDAAFAVILISDEDESDKDFENVPQNLINHVKNTWSDKKRFSFHSIITRPGDEKCKKEWEHRYGHTYNLMSELTDGIVGSVCESDYSSQLSAIGEKVKDDVRTYILSCAPVAIEPNKQPQIEVILQGGGQAPPYQVIGNKVIFAKDLPVGDHVMKFKCLKAENHL